MSTAMENAPTDSVVELDQRWRERRAVWARKLGRIHLSVEPLSVQLDRYRRMTWGMSAVTSIIGMMFIALFSAFGRPDVGLITVAILLLPVVIFSWIGYLRLAGRVASFEREYENYQAERRRLNTDAAPTST